MDNLCVLVRRQRQDAYLFLPSKLPYNPPLFSTTSTLLSSPLAPLPHPPSQVIEYNELLHCRYYNRPRWSGRIGHYIAARSVDAKVICLSGSIEKSNVEKQNFRKDKRLFSNVPSNDGKPSSIRSSARKTHTYIGTR